MQEKETVELERREQALMQRQRDEWSVENEYRDSESTHSRVLIQNF